MVLLIRKEDRLGIDIKTGKWLDLQMCITGRKITAGRQFVHSENYFSTERGKKGGWEPSCKAIRSTQIVNMYIL